MSNTLNKIKKKKYMKLSSSYYKNYDIDDKGRFVYNHRLVKTLDDLDYLDTKLYLKHLEETEEEEIFTKKKNDELLRNRRLY